MTSQVDAVVVGAGHQGLVAANLLADHGWSVLVLEEQPEPGGAVRSVELAPGFVADLFSAVYPMTVASPVFARLALHEHGLRWARAPGVLAHVLPDDRAVLLARDPADTARSVSAFHPDDGAAWLAMVDRWDAVGWPLVDAVLGSFPPVRPSLRLLRRAGLGDSVRLARLAALSVLRLGEEEFRGEGARLLLTGNALHADVPATAPGSALLGWLLAMIGQTRGFPVPVGGAGRITDALVARLTEAGGRVECGRPVRRVLVERGRATGVVDAAGDEVHARRAVLADVPAPALYRQLVGDEHLPQPLRDDLDRFTWDHATVKVNWALDAPIPWTATEPRRAGVVHLGRDLTGLADGAHDLAMGRQSEQAFVLLGQMTTTDPTRSPAGTESAWAYTHLPRDCVATAEAAAEAVAREVALIESQVEQHAPGFLARVRARTVQGPHELQSANSNLVLGAVNAGTAQIWQQLVFRPVPGLGRPETFVDRLFLAGASGHPGGSVQGVAGANAARAAVLRDRMLTRPVGWGLHRLQAHISGA